MNEKTSRGVFHVTDDSYKIEDRYTRYNKIVWKVKADILRCWYFTKSCRAAIPLLGTGATGKPNTGFDLSWIHGFMDSW